MQHCKNLFLVTLILTLTGCQTLPSPISDLRNKRAVNEVAAQNTSGSDNKGTPIAEILSRSNKPNSDTNPESAKKATSQASFEEPSQLSIGLIPSEQQSVTTLDQQTTATSTPNVISKTPPEVIERSASAVSLPTNQASDQADLTTSNVSVQEIDNIGTSVSQPVSAFSDSAKLEMSLAPINNSAASVSDKLNWLPTLEDTLSMMDSQVQRSTQLDDKIDALMSLAYVIDAQLYIAFRDLLDRLDETSGDALMTEQQAWLGERKENLTRAYLEFAADKAGRYNAAQAFLRNSHERMRELDARRKRLMANN